MRTVNVAELRNGLSKYLAAVRQGEEIVIRARRRLFAKIVPLRVWEGTEEAELLLAAEGLLKLGEGPLPTSFWSKPSVRVSARKLERAISTTSRAEANSEVERRRSRKMNRKERR